MDIYIWLYVLTYNTNRSNEINTTSPASEWSKIVITITSSNSYATVGAKVFNCDYSARFNVENYDS